MTALLGAFRRERNGAVADSMCYYGRSYGLNSVMAGAETAIVPAIAALNLGERRSWCRYFCPVGALLSLIAGFNKTTRPKADKSLCVRSDGTPCTICSGVCPEHIDPCDDLGDRPLSECTRCGKCIESCPYGALSFTKSNKRVEAKATATAVGEE